MGIFLAVWQQMYLYSNVILPSQMLEDEAECPRRGFYAPSRLKCCECSVALQHRVNEHHKGGAESTQSPQSSARDCYTEKKCFKFFPGLLSFIVYQSSHLNFKVW